MVYGQQLNQVLPSYLEFAVMRKLHPFFVVSLFSCEYSMIAIPGTTTVILQYSRAHRANSTYMNTPYSDY